MTQAANPFAKAPAPGSRDPDDLNHVVCCRQDPLTALCGYVVQPEDVEIGYHEVTPPDNCIVCVTMLASPCPVCGASGA